MVAGTRTTHSLDFGMAAKLLLLGAFALSADALILPSIDYNRRTAVLGAATATLLGTAPTNTATAAAVHKTWMLANGVEMPTLALNTAGMTADASERATREALAAGITHVDFHPGIERDGVARFLASSPASRSAIFLTTKIAKPKPGTAPAAAAELVSKQIDADLSVLGLPSVDMLMLRDSPDCDVMQAQWAAMEGALASKKCRALGLINYCESSLQCILQTAKTKPALNYFMQHVGMGPASAGSLRAFGEARGIKTFAYGALGEPGPSDELLTSPTLKKIGDAHARSTEEVALRWLLQNGCAVSARPTSNFGLGTSACAEGEACKAGLRARSQAFDWALTAAEMRELDAMTSPGGNPTLFSSLGCPDSFFATFKG